MPTLDHVKLDELRFTSLGLRHRMTLCLETWQRLREHARLRTERRRINIDLRGNYNALIDIKARAMKSTGVFATEHENLESAIVHLAYAIEDYRDGV